MDSIYERALSEIGANGKFQKRFDLFYNLVFSTLWPLAYNNVILALVIIPHSCKLPENYSNVSDEVWKSKYIPMTEDSVGKQVYSSCLIFVNPDINNSTKDCESFTYDKTWYESTIPSVNNWVCNDEIYVANVFAYSKIGEVIGSVSVGWFGDTYGRRLTYILSLALLVTGRIITLIGSYSYVLIVIGCIISSFPSWSVVQSATVISMEISAPERRSLTASYRTISYSTSMTVMPLLYWWLRDWKPFMIMTTLSQVPFLIFSWKIIESPRWLWNEGKSKACVKVLKRIARVNNSKLEETTEHEILASAPPDKDQILGPLSLFSGCKLAMQTTIQLYLWIAVTMSYMVLIMSSGEKAETNPFAEFAWQSIFEIPGTFIGAWLADKLGRRYTGAMSYLVTALIFLLCVVRDSGTDTWFQIWWIGSALVILNRLIITIAYYVIYLLNMELYPTCLRQSGMALGNVFSSLACAIVPYLMYAGHQFDARIPGFVLIFVSLFAFIASLLLPETLNAKLPETLKDAQSFGIRKRSYISVETNATGKNNTNILSDE